MFPHGNDLMNATTVGLWNAQCRHFVFAIDYVHEKSIEPVRPRMIVRLKGSDEESINWRCPSASSGPVSRGLTLSDLRSLTVGGAYIFAANSPPRLQGDLSHT